MASERRLPVVILAALALSGGPWLGGDGVQASGPVDALRPTATDTCESHTHPADVTSVDEFESLLVGTWVRCAGDPFPGSVVDDVGIEITVDGRFYRVFRLPDGSLARATGPEQEGDWTVGDATELNGSGELRVDWTMVGSGTSITVARLFDSPPRLQLEDLPLRRLVTFERWAGASPDTSQPPVTVGACPALGDRVVPMSVDEFESLLVGTWVRCAGDPFPGSVVDDVGIEITVDGRFYRVFRLPDGSLARATGPEQEGDWTVWDTTDMNGPGAYQVDWTLLGSGPTMAFPRFFGASAGAGEPSMFHLAESLSGAYFERWAGAPPDTSRPTAAAASGSELASTGPDAVATFAALAVPTAMMGLLLIVVTRTRRRDRPRT